MQQPMTGQKPTELVAPTEVHKGDVIEDPVSPRWMTVSQVQMVSDLGNGTFGFYGDSPDDRLTFEASDLVKRQKAR